MTAIVNDSNPTMRIALIGAGGKMGCRLADNFVKTSHTVDYIEVSPAGSANLQARGLRVRQTRRGSLADVVILAVPDVVMGSVAADVVGRMKPGALLMTLDPAAPLDGQVPTRDDIGCTVTHPCHPSVFNWEPTEAAFRDFYGGISAKQAVVAALIYGDESHYERASAWPVRLPPYQGSSHPRADASSSRVVENAAPTA